jgi:hypothetical protein
LQSHRLSARDFRVVTCRLPLNWMSGNEYNKQHLPGLEGCRFLFS